MRTGTFFMNNDGSRWVVLPRSKYHRFLLICPDGERKVRLADFFSSLGNFALTHFRYCGKRYSYFCDTLPDDQTDLPFIDMRPKKHAREREGFHQRTDGSSFEVFWGVFNGKVSGWYWWTCALSTALTNRVASNVKAHGPFTISTGAHTDARKGH